MQTHIIIRPFCVEDSAVVSRIIHRCLREVNVRDYGEQHIAHMLPTFSEENLPRWFEGAEPYVLVAMGEIVATGTVRGHDVQTVFVLPEHHGKGHGKQIMAFLEAHIRRNGFEEARLNSSLTSKDFYLGLGYRVVTEVSGGVGGQMLAMSKKL